MPASDQSIENETRHAIYLNRFAGGLHNEFLPFLDELRKEISARLAMTQTPANQARLNELIKGIKDIQTEIYDSYQSDLFNQLGEFSEHEADFEINSLNDVYQAEYIKPAPEQLIAAANKATLVFPDSNDVILLKPFINNWTKSEIKRVSDIIRTGYAIGDTNSQMARKITGKNGVLDKQARRNNRALVRTATNHISSTARHAVMEQNEDIVIGYEWISTLDSRTTSECRSLDGKEFKLTDKYQPKPPIHIGCRSSTGPIFDPKLGIDRSRGKRGAAGSKGRGQVSAKTNYYTFLKNQSVEFQDDVLGPTRAKLLRDGGLTADEFSRLTVDQKFRPLTLAEMRKKNPLAFDRAGI